MTAAGGGRRKHSCKALTLLFDLKRTSASVGGLVLTRSPRRCLPCARPFTNSLQTRLALRSSGLHVPLSTRV